MKIIANCIAWLHSTDPNVRAYWMGLIMLFAGLVWLVSLSVALIVVGAGIALESALTSYLVAVLNSRSK